MSIWSRGFYHLTNWIKKIDIGNDKEQLSPLK